MRTVERHFSFLQFQNFFDRRNDLWSLVFSTHDLGKIAAVEIQPRALRDLLQQPILRFIEVDQLLLYRFFELRRVRFPQLLYLKCRFCTVDNYVFM